MPELISKYRIFLASPSDLAAEREDIDDVISELNITYGKANNIVIELLKWEKNAAPGISTNEVQSLINSDIPDYDLFIGLLWMKFGTPTKQFGSGTEEEFNIAHEKFKKDANSVQILFYFKNSLPQSLDEINPNELSKVRAFKTSLGEKNVLYWEFNLKEELGRYLRIHIPARIDNLKNNKPEQITFQQPNDKTIEIINQETEYGTLDYEELIEESFATSTHALGKITEATAWITKEMNKKTAEINKKISANQTLGFKAQRDIFTRTASVLQDFANRLEPEIPIYMTSFDKGIDAFSKLINLYKSDFDNKRDNEVIVAKNSLNELLEQTSESINSMKGFLQTLESWPRMSKELNNARRNAANKLGELIDRLEISHSIATEVYKNI